MSSVDRRYDGVPIQEAETGMLAPPSVGRPSRRAILISAGASKNRNVYPPHVLAEAVRAGLFEGIPIYADHAPGLRSVRDKIGIFRHVEWDGQAVVGEPVPIVPWFSDVLAMAALEGAHSAVHFSINARAQTDRSGTGQTVQRITDVESCDLVSVGAAGGRLLESVAWHGIPASGGYVMRVIRPGISLQGHQYELGALATAHEHIKPGVPVHVGHPLQVSGAASLVGRADRPHLDRYSGLWAAFHPSDLGRFHGLLQESQQAGRHRGVSIEGMTRTMPGTPTRVTAFTAVSGVDLVLASDRPSAGGFVPTLSSGRPIPIDHPRALSLAEAQIEDVDRSTLAASVQRLEAALGRLARA